MRFSRLLLCAISLATFTAIPAGAGPVNLQEMYDSKDPLTIRNGVDDEPAATIERGAKSSAFSIPGCPINPGPIPSQDYTKETGILPFRDAVHQSCATLAATSKRVEAITGWNSPGGRDIFALRITNHNREEDARAQQMRNKILVDPQGVQADLASGKIKPWKQAIMISGNIHGSEGEGTDTLVRWATYLANADEQAPMIQGASSGPTVGEFLNQYELILVPSVNPDGRTSGTRRNGAGIDLNRDHVTRSQPETRALQDLLLRFQPVLHMDLHGYYNPNGNALGLVEPAGTPHSVAMNRKMLEDRMNGWISRLDAHIINRPEVVAMGFDAKRVGVAMRDEANGNWDDWAPVYTSVWSTLMNGAGVTVEAPYNPFGRTLPDGKNPAVAGNIAFMQGAIDALVEMAAQEHSALLDSLLTYRAQAIAGHQGGASQTWPEGWIIHAPDRQHPKANVDHLVKNLTEKGVKVNYLAKDTLVNGQEAKAGSVIISAKQPYRALASVTLSPGARVPGDRTTDLAAWSPGQLWGVRVNEIPAGIALPETTAETPTMPKASDKIGPFKLLPRSFDQVRLVNDLLKRGVKLYRDPNEGSIIIPADELGKIGQNFEANGFTQAEKLPEKLEVVRKLRVGITSDDAHTNWLEILGFDAVYVDLLKSTSVPKDIDVLILTRHIGAQAAASVGAWVKDGGALIAIDGGQHMLTDMGITTTKPIGLGRRAAGLISTTQHSNDPVMPGRPINQVELVEPYNVWETVPAGFSAVQTIPQGSGITSGVWPDNYVTGETMYLTIAGNYGDGRLVASGAQRILRHHMLGQADELFDWMQWASQPTTVTPTFAGVERIAGQDRVATSLALAAKTHPVKADTVVIASSESWADTLVAGPLATKNNAPILLTGKDKVNPQVLERIRALGPSRIIVVGGEQMVSDDILTTLRTNSSAQVERLSGQTRFETSAAVAATFGPGTDILAATGSESADALTGGVLSARNEGVTLLLPKTGKVPQAVIDQVNRIGDADITVIGGPQAVSETVLDQLRTPARKTSRIAGRDRYETAVAVAKALNPTPVIAVANGGSTADALLATPLVHKEKGAILLTGTNLLPEVTATAITSIDPKQVLIIGGEQVVSPETAHVIATRAMNHTKGAGTP